MRGGEARLVLILDPDASPALRLQEELASMAGRRVWLCHERTLADALAVLSVTRCDVVLMEADAGDEPWVEMARKVQRLGPEATVILYGESASDLSVPREDPVAAARILLRLLGLEVRRSHSD